MHFAKWSVGFTNQELAAAALNILQIYQNPPPPPLHWFCTWFALGLMWYSKYVYRAKYTLYYYSIHEWVSSLYICIWLHEWVSSLYICLWLHEWVSSLYICLWLHEWESSLYIWIWLNEWVSSLCIWKRLHEWKSSLYICIWLHEWENSLYIWCIWLNEW